jgi:hypothetical protein
VTGSVQRLTATGDEVAMVVVHHRLVVMVQTPLAARAAAGTRAELLIQQVAQGGGKDFHSGLVSHAADGTPR